MYNGDDGIVYGAGGVFINRRAFARTIYMVASGYIRLCNIMQDDNVYTTVDARVTCSLRSAPSAFFEG